MLPSKTSTATTTWALPALFAIFFISGFTALLYQVVWQRMLGLFSGSDVRSVTIVVASYLVGLGLGSLFGGFLSDRLSSRQSVQTYGLCNLGIAAFAVFSRFLFYDLLFLKLRYLARSPVSTLLIAFISLLIPTILMGLSLPLLSKAIACRADKAASGIGLLYGINTLGSGLGSLICGWYIIGTLGYEETVYVGAALNAMVGIVALGSAYQFGRDRFLRDAGVATIDPLSSPVAPSVKNWCILVFLSGFVAISLEIIWFRVLDIALQSNAYTYAHLLAFLLVSNALGSLMGAKAIRYIRQPRRVFLAIQGFVAAYSAIAIWFIGLYWQSHPDLRSDIGYIDPNNITAAVVFKYLVLPSIMIVLPNLLLGFYFPLVQKAVQTDDRTIGRRVGLILVANILGNTAGSLLTGLVLLDKLGTANSLRLLVLLGLGFVLAIRPNWMKAKFIGALALILLAAVVFFPNNTRLWASLHSIEPEQYFIVAEDSTGVAAIAQDNRQGMLLASGQIQANFPYMHVHALLGSIPALLHPNPAQVMIIGLGSGGTPHTIGVNPLTQRVRVVEILGAELPVLQEYAKTTVGKPLGFLFQDPRYDIVVNDGRRELVLADRKFDIIEADAIQPWRSRAGMLYSQEFFQEVRSRLAPGGFFAQWNVGPEAEQTFRNVFPSVTRLDLSGGLSVLIGSERPVDFNREKLLTRLDSPAVSSFLAKAGVNVEAIRTDVKAAGVSMYSHEKDGQPKAINTDLFARSEYYLNRPSK
ncbi:spermine synthase [Hydrococcus rivularis NIES-593]|uniref:Spermine synthase n=1 Tax=Hydrococcus rivularis NIES-593 TaxID=1921803 RepID=A0A1U7HFH2_9CYAN|nr:fused MFS/spermidine synthase [Hydrococcus rivularis]OKH22352.1 spermine synthase [Hydrococcus rivularis NIES-593]